PSLAVLADTTVTGIETCHRSIVDAVAAEEVPGALIWRVIGSVAGSVADTPARVRARVLETLEVVQAFLAQERLAETC
ncbi:hypothetical protein, partial [Nocardia paucivorans]|uniref:hypothetical protein n=1 Tax=Nocardia paucivorans TaxID=114259 RepID=UPI000594E671